MDGLLSFSLVSLHNLHVQEKPPLQGGWGILRRRYNASLLWRNLAMLKYEYGKRSRQNITTY
jgi:hypothetical protein